MKAGPSNIYRRLLAGKVTPERYVAVLKRAVAMRMRLDTHERHVAEALAQRGYGDWRRKRWFRRGGGSV